MGETRSKTQLPMHEILERIDQGQAAFANGMLLGRDVAQRAARKVAAWAEENPGQLLLAGLATGFLLGKLLLHTPRVTPDDV